MEVFYRKRKGLKYRFGFTLIEMLVVISIIGILAALLMPSMMKALRAAKVLQCQNNFKNIGVIAHSYSSDWNAQLPPFCADVWKAAERNKTWSYVDPLWNALKLYGLNGEIAQCPLGKYGKKWRSYWLKKWQSRSSYFYKMVEGSIYNRSTYTPLKVTVSNSSGTGIAWDTATDFDKSNPVNNHTDRDGLTESQSVLFLDGHVDLNRWPDISKRYGLGF